MAAFPLTAFGATVTSGNQLQDPVPLTSVVQETVTVDPNNPLGTALAGGYYSVDLALENGINRTAYQYVPKTVGYRQPEVAIAVPSGAEAGQFILDSGWKAVADENEICLVLLPDEVYTLYDFMSSYSRGSDGTSYYMNMPITGTSDH